MYLCDAWLNRKDLAEDFARAMEGEPRKGNPDEVIDYSELKVGESVPLEKKVRKW